MWKTDSGAVAFAYATNEANEIHGMPSFAADERWFFFAEAKHGTNLKLGTAEALPVAIIPRFSIFRPDPKGEQVAVANRTRVEIWNLKSGKLERSLESASRIASVAWSHSGRELATGCFNGDIIIWDVQTGSMRQLIGHTAVVLALMFSGDDGRLCSAGGDGSSRLWEISSGRVLLTMEGQVIQMSEDERQLALFQGGVGLGLWQFAPATGSRILRLSSGFRGAGWDVDLSPDGRWLAWGEPDELHVWDLNSERPPLVVSCTNLYTVFWHPHEPMLFAIANGRLETQVVSPAPSNAPVGVSLGQLSPVAIPADIHPAMAAISGNARTLALVGDDGKLWIGELNQTNSFVCATNEANPSGPFGSGSLTGSGRVAVSPDGQWVATVDMARAPFPHVFDARTGFLIKILPTATATVGFSSDGQWLATGGKKEIGLWSVGTWSKLWQRPRTGPPNMESSVAFSSDKPVLAVSESFRLTALLDRANGEELAEFTPPDSSANGSVRLSADGNRLVVPTLNGTVLIWDMPVIRRELATLKLDWNQSSTARENAPGRSDLARSTGVIMFGLACVTPAAFFALRALRRHRLLLQEFVQSEAEAQRRSRELEAARIELMHSQKMKALGTLAAGIAHDFNNLLSVIRMSNKLIGRATKDDPDLTEEVANIEEAVQQGKQVVGSMLGYSREQASDEGMCDLDEVIEETVSLLNREFLSGIQLILALDPSAPPVLVGRGRLEQILLNLLVNASEAMNGQGKLELAVHQERLPAKGGFVLHPREGDSFVELRVADSGPGIAPEILPRIFDPFFTTKSAGAKQGTGLGLSMVYSIAEQEGLGIAVESPLGGGAVFRIFLPAAKAVKNPTPEI